MAEVFISHSLQDKNTAEEIRVYLEERGVSCRSAPGKITPGSAWAGKQNIALSEMKVFVLIYSESSAASGQVARELELAQGRADVTIIPYRTDDTPLSGSFEKFLAGSKWIRSDPDNNYMKPDELYGRISAVPDKRKDWGNASRAEGNVSAETKKRIIRPRVAVLGCAFLLSLAAFGAWDYLSKDRIEDETGNDFIYVPNDSDEVTDDTGNVTVRFMNAGFNGEYSGDTDANGVPDGTGEFSGSFTNSDGKTKLKYSGSFRKGVFSGKGKSEVVYANGDKCIYEGEFADGDCKGDGTQNYYCASGDFEKQ